MVCVASGGVGLPDLDEAVPYRASVAVEDEPRNDDPLTQRLAGMLASQVVVKLSQRLAPVCWTCGVRERPGEDDQGLLRRPEPRRNIVRVEVRGLGAVVLAPVPSGFFSLPLCHATCPLLAPLYTYLKISAFQHFSTSPVPGNLSAIQLTRAQALAVWLTRRRSRRADKPRQSWSMLKCSFTRWWSLRRSSLAGCLLSPLRRLRSQALCGPASPGPPFPRASAGRRACRDP